MSNGTAFEAIAAVGRTSEEEINFMLGDQEFDIDEAVQEGELQEEEEEVPQMYGRAKAATFNSSGGEIQTSIIDAAIDYLEDDLKFDGITFDNQHQDEFTSMPALTGYASMAGFNSGLNFDNFQYNMFNYPPPPPVYNTMPNTCLYNTGFNRTGFNNSGLQNISFHNTTMPMFPSNSTSRFPTDLELNQLPLSRASMQASMFSSDVGLNASMAMKGNCPSYLTMYDDMSTFDLGGNSEPHYRGPLKKRRVDKANFGRPVVGPSRSNTHMLTEKTPYGPFHLVAIKECAVLDMGEAAVAARKARKMRRMKRAKAHILHLLDSSVSDIENAAVSDADYNDPYDLGLTQDEQCEHLLRDYTDNFDAKTFVEGLWDGIYLALSSAEEKPEEEVQVDEPTTKAIVNDDKSTKGNSSVAANLIQLMRRKPGFSKDAPDDISSDVSPSTTLKLPNMNANVSCNPDAPRIKSHAIIHSNHIVTPTASDVAQTKKRSLDGSNVSHTAPLPLVPSNLSSKTAPSSPVAISSSPGTSVSQKGEMYADLPDGNDEESRRLRRLMRNRLSAQRSRDKRRRDIELYTKLKVQKVEEIASTKKALIEEKEGLKKLEEMVNFAKTFLGPTKFATVVSK